MKKLSFQILFALFTAAAVRADTALTIGANYSCFDLFTPYASPPMEAPTFSLNGGANGTGTFQSGVSGYYNFFSERFYKYNYAIDLSGITAPSSHCIKLVVHFGTPLNCANGDLLSPSYPAVETSPSQVQSATLSPFGDITFVFAGGCLAPGQPAVSFTMVSAVAWKTNSVTIIDDYVSPSSGMTNEWRTNVVAIVPDIPPTPPWWALAPMPIPTVFFQGTFICNAVPQLPTHGMYDFEAQLFTSPTNGLAMSEVVTQSVAVSNGLFNMPLPFGPITYGRGGTSAYLGIAVRPTGSNVNFTPLNSPLPISPTPQALYAFTADTVADLTPGQAVTSLNGLTDTVNLQAGSGIVLDTNGNTLTISAQAGGVSDRNLKTDFRTINPETILSKVAALPIESWRYTNELAGTRHVGPMAQDFKAAFDLGNSDKMIGYLDASGVALSAIQGLNQKLEEQRSELDRKQTEIDDLKQRLERMENLLNKSGGAQ